MATAAYGTKVNYKDNSYIHDTHLCPVEFRLVVFKPFVSEVLIGKVESSTEEGIRGANILESLLQVVIMPYSPVSMTFFDDIWIPADNLPLPSTLYVPFARPLCPLTLILFYT